MVAGMDQLPKMACIDQIHFSVAAATPLSQHSIINFRPVSSSQRETPNLLAVTLLFPKTPLSLRN